MGTGAPLGSTRYQLTEHHVLTSEEKYGMAQPFHLTEKRRLKGSDRKTRGLPDRSPANTRKLRGRTREETKHVVACETTVGAEGGRVLFIFRTLPEMGNPTRQHPLPPGLGGCHGVLEPSTIIHLFPITKGVQLHDVL
jgi:hypothetical protein